MSLLPQRKKSAEELAKLREALGIPGQQAQEDAATLATEPVLTSPIGGTPQISLGEIHIDAPPPLDAPKPAEESPVASLDPLPIHAAHAPKPVRSLKRSERVPVMPTVVSTSPAPVEHLATSHEKQVRSLRKSEQVALADLPHHTPPVDSSLPFHRHSDREISEIRRQAAIAQQNSAPLFITQIAHIAVLIPGYLAALAGGIAFYFYDVPLVATASCAAAALLVAVFIFIRKPLSRHHAAFITMITLFVIVFGALHYFPQLRHGS
jgi:hypothetical protein